MPELRWNPLLGTYTLVATGKPASTSLTNEPCPFCPGSGKVPDKYDVLVYPSDTPSLSINPDEPAQKTKGLYRVLPAYGVGEIILYSSEHDKPFSQLSPKQITRIVEVWAERFADLSQNGQIKYIFPFENSGEEIGGGNNHPHGRLYAYPFLPLKIEGELTNCRKYYIEHGENLFDAMNKEEKDYGKRMVLDDKYFTAYIPYFSDNPYGVYIVAKNSRLHLAEMEANEHKALAKMLKKITNGFYRLFNRPFPYKMAIHQAPVNMPEWGDCRNYFRFHIEFYSSMVDETVLKQPGSPEFGDCVAANTQFVEESALELRQSIKRFI